MSYDRLGIFKAPDSEDKFIVEVMDDQLAADQPLHTSIELAADEAKNFLRHYNLNDSEIDLRLAGAGPLARAAVATDLG